MWYIVIMCCVVLWCIVMWCIVLWCIVQCFFVVWCIVMWCIVMWCMVLWCIVMWCIVTALHFIRNSEDCFPTSFDKWAIFNSYVKLPEGIHPLLLTLPFSVWRYCQDQLTNVQQVFATHRAFAALKADGRIVTWGHPGYGGDSSKVHDQLPDLKWVVMEYGWVWCRIM